MLGRKEALGDWVGNGVLAVCGIRSPVGLRTERMKAGRQTTLRSRTAVAGIGVHSGLIFGKMGFNKVTKKIQDIAPWFGGDITVGVGAVLVLLLLWFLIWLIYLRGESNPELN